MKNPLEFFSDRKKRPVETVLEQTFKDLEQVISEKKQSQNQEFERQVKSLVEGSPLFPEKQITSNTKLGIIQAIEKNELTLYVGERESDKVHDAVQCLIAIYDELGRDEPDDDFIAQTVEQLRGYL